MSGSQASKEACFDVQLNVDFVDAVRARPGMYVGGADAFGLHHMLWEVVANSLDQHLIGHASHIDVRTHDDGSIEVCDDGAGIPMTQFDNGDGFLERAMTTFRSDATFDDHAPHLHLTGGGTGLMPICALSEWIDVEVCRSQRRFHQRFERGRVASELIKLGPSQRSGTSVRFKPDKSIFEAATWDVDRIQERLHQLCALMPGLRASLNDQLFGPSELRDLLEGDASLAGPFEIVASHDLMTVRLVMCWSDRNDRAGNSVRSFANAMQTKEGSHVRGFMEGLAAAMVRLGARKGSWVDAFEHLSRGMSAVISVMLIDPSYGAPTRDRLVHPRVRELIKRTVAEQLPAQLPATMRDELLSRLR